MTVGRCRCLGHGLSALAKTSTDGYNHLGRHQSRAPDSRHRRSSGVPDLLRHFQEQRRSGELGHGHGRYCGVVRRYVLLVPFILGCGEERAWANKCV